MVSLQRPDKLIDEYLKEADIVDVQHREIHRRYFKSLSNALSEGFADNVIQSNSLDTESKTLERHYDEMDFGLNRENELKIHELNERMETIRRNKFKLEAMTRRNFDNKVSQLIHTAMNEDPSILGRKTESGNHRLLEVEEYIALKLRRAESEMNMIINMLKTMDASYHHMKSESIKMQRDITMKYYKIKAMKDAGFDQLTDYEKVIYEVDP